MGVSFPPPHPTGLQPYLSPSTLLWFLPEVHCRPIQGRSEEMFSAEIADENEVVHNTNSENCNAIFFTE